MKNWKKIHRDGPGRVETSALFYGMEVGNTVGIRFCEKGKGIAYLMQHLAFILVVPRGLPTIRLSWSYPFIAVFE